jgi:DNA-binding transcriptional MerR regulator
VSSSTVPESEPSDSELTIDRLAAASGFTVRTIRSYTTRGLLPPPRLRGRTGLYGPEHLSRLSAVRQMLDDGFTLAAAEQLLATAPEGVTSSGLDVYRALLNPWAAEQPEILTREAVEALVETKLTDERLAQLVDLGLMTPLEDDRFRVESPSMMRAGQQLASLGLQYDDVMRTQAELSRQATAMAQSCVTLFKKGVWDPFDEQGRPDEGWPQVRLALDRALPVASQAVLITFRRAVTLTIADVIEQEQASDTSRMAQMWTRPPVGDSAPSEGPD